MRRVSIPSSSAFRLISTAPAPAMIRSRIHSVISMTSKRPTRPVYPVPLQAWQPLPFMTRKLPIS